MTSPTPTSRLPSTCYSGVTCLFLWISFAFPFTFHPADKHFAGRISLVKETDPTSIFCLIGYQVTSILAGCLEATIGTLESALPAGGMLRRFVFWLKHGPAAASWCVSICAAYGTRFGVRSRETQEVYVLGAPILTHTHVQLVFLASHLCSLVSAGFPELFNKK